MAHRITFTSKYGAHCIVRVLGQPDRDMAVIAFNSQIDGATIQSVEFVEDDARREWGEQNISGTDMGWSDDRLSRPR